MDYVTANSTFKFCNGTSWIDMGVWLPNGTSVYYNGGNVGIGTNDTVFSSGATGSVLGIGSASNNAQLFLGQSSTAHANLAWIYNATEANAYLVLGPRTANDLAFKTSNTEYMRITSTGNVTMSGTGSLKLPTGTTAQQPTCNTGAAGSIRFNSQTAGVEACNGTAWASVGGGGGGSYTGNLVNAVHTGTQCLEANGYPVDVGSSTYVCKFWKGGANAISCPPTWTQYLNWRSTVAAGCGLCSSCTTGFHSTFANTAPETCGYNAYGPYGDCTAPNQVDTCTASSSYVGCY